MQTTLTICHLVLAIFTVQILAAPIGAQEPSPTSSPAVQVSDEDLVHFGDVIDVDVVGGFEFDWRGKLNPEGFLDGLDGFSEPVVGLCRSESQIATDIAKLYGKILKDPQIVVRIIDRSERALVRLEGAVRTPTRFRLRRRASLRELLTLSGGLIDSSSGDVTIFRPQNLSCSAARLASSPADNTSSTTNIKISDLLKGNEAADPQILSGDIISVLTADPVYVVGAVGNPRPIFSREKMSVTRAIAMAGGLTKNADAGKVTIFRRELGETKIIEAELRKIKSGETIDELLKPFDILEVAARGRQKQKYPPVTVRQLSGDPKAELPLRVVE